jgi:hypothetical protein
MSSINEMENSMINKYSFIVVLLVILSASCNAGGVIGQVPVVVNRQVQAAYFYEPGAPSSLNTSFALQFLKSELDNRQQWYNKVEWNPGDGAEWIDITNYYRANLEHASTLTYALGYKYIYAAPGTYPAQARVTYWDGEVVYSQTYNFTIPNPAL